MCAIIIIVIILLYDIGVRVNYGKDEKVPTAQLCRRYSIS